MIGIFLAYHDMRGNIAFGLVILIVGAVILLMIKGKAGTRKTCNGWAIAALIVAPVITLSLFVANIYWLSPSSYIRPEDYKQDFVAFNTIGVISGVLGAAVFWIAGRMPIHWLTAGRSSDREDGRDLAKND